jgi:hypothetical protein
MQQFGTDCTVWYHDGITTRSSCENEGDFNKFSSRNLLKCRQNNLILVVCKSLIIRKIPNR